MLWAGRFAACALLAQLASTAGQAQKKRKRGGKKGGFRDYEDPKNAYGWSNYRFTRYDKKPHLQDKQSSMLAGGDTKCEVCEVILTKALKDLVKENKLKGGPDDQDIIEDHLEADHVDVELIEKTKNRMEKYVVKYKKGCQKHFKDSFLALGWYIAPCHKQLDFDMPDQPPEGRVPWACARDAHQPPEDLDSMNTYTVEREAAWYACETTITRHREDIAKFIVANWTDFKDAPPQKIAKAACISGGRCQERKATESVEARARKMLGLSNERGDFVEDTIKEVKREMKKSEKEKKLKKKQERAEKRREKNKDSVEL